MSDVITVPSHTKKDNPKAAPQTPYAPSMTRTRPYVVMLSGRGHPAQAADLPAPVAAELINVLAALVLAGAATTSPSP
jgi:hypothetical protein